MVRKTDKQDQLNDTNGSGRRFAVSAIWASLLLILGEQLVIVLRSPTYFGSIGEWIWNLFVSMSFLWSFVTLYGFVGGVCWQTMVAHVDPFGHFRRARKRSLHDPKLDRQFAAELLGLVVSALCYFGAAFVILLHFSSAYNNKTLAALLYLLVMVLLLPFAIVVYAALRRLTFLASAPLERWFPRRVVAIELLLLNLAAIIGLIAWIASNQTLWLMLDVTPLLLLGVFLLTQVVLYRLFSHPMGRELLDSSTHAVSTGMWLLLVGLMLAITFLAYPSQPRVAGILRNQAPLTRPVILAVQRISDRDGDGFSALLRGGDCDDHNPLVHPMATEIPRNGIDDDCMGGDASQRPPLISEIQDQLLAQRIDSIKSDYNIVLISIDAVRADHLKSMGYTRDTMPEIEEWAKQSLVFTQAHAQAPNTPQSIPSFISGTYPSQIHWSHYHNFPKVQNQTETAIDVFKQKGYHVAGIFPYWYFKNRNLQRGADWWDTRAFRERGHAENVRTSDLLTDYAIEHLDSLRGSRQPLFMWVHYFDPHFLYVSDPDNPFGQKQMDLYDAELRFTSREVNRLLTYFKTTEWYENSVIILTADHGEEFLDHGRRYHGSQLYQESVHVPLIIHSPRLSAHRVDTPVSLVDLVPTMYDLIGVNPKKHAVQGTSLMALALAEHPNEISHPPVYFEKLRAPTFPWSMQGIRQGHWKLIHRADEQLFELYDLQNDPKEKQNLFDLLPEKAAQMQMLIGEFRQQNLTRDSNWYRMAVANGKSSH